MSDSYLRIDPWNIIEEQWNAAKHPASESIFSLGNGHMGQRANFEEDYSGKHLQGSYIAGVYYPDKTRVGWWKNGYPEYFAKVLNSVNWIGITIRVAGEVLDLHNLKVHRFERILSMKEGLLRRTFEIEFAQGKRLKVQAERFLSMQRREIGAIRYSLTPLNFSAPIEFCPYLDFDVANHDSNYGEKFWEGITENVGSQKGVIQAKTRKLDFQVAAAMRYELWQGDEHITLYPETEKRSKYIANHFSIKAEEGVTYSLYKYAAIVSTLHHAATELSKVADELASAAMRISYPALREEQINYWRDKWAECDIEIKGDVAAQQAIRFNIFQLSQTYTGDDPRLNIGPKGFTGEKYGGSTYWDTEAYCLPFYMSTAGQEVARNLLVYRYKHLGKAIENAGKLGFSGGAALYPMVTMNGEECHNEWEITFEEIHRNGAIAYAIYNYSRYYGDVEYLHGMGLEVLIGISRFWSQRVNWSEAKQKYVMLGVTGPNEYENNVNNNWYTNYIARWTLQYTLHSLEGLQQASSKAYDTLMHKCNLREEESAHWKKIIEHFYLPADESLGIVLQQDNFLDKELQPAESIAESERPINQHWSWDRILRSCFIKQADVLQGMYFFRDHFSREEIERNFDFYEPKTVHESSLSPCVHVVLAAYLNRMDKAYELYLRTSRLDLDDYNKEVHEGLHITSMAGTWLSVVEGFGGMRVEDDQLKFEPRLPAHWEELSFVIKFREKVLKVRMTQSGAEIAEAENPAQRSNSLSS